MSMETRASAVRYLPLSEMRIEGVGGFTNPQTGEWIETATGGHFPTSLVPGSRPGEVIVDDYGAKQREFFRAIEEVDRDGWRSVSPERWVLFSGGDIVATTSQPFGGGDHKGWVWSAAMWDGERWGIYGGPASLTEAKAAAGAALVIGVRDMEMSKCWKLHWEGEYERAREALPPGPAWAPTSQPRSDALAADDPTIARLNAVAAAQDALALGVKAVQAAVKLGGGETLRGIVGAAVERLSGVQDPEVWSCR